MYAVPMGRLPVAVFNWALPLHARPCFVATRLPVAGVTCIKPKALAEDRALSSMALSERMVP